MAEAPRSPLITLNAADGPVTKAVAAVKPLQTRSRLPQPGSRLPQPGSSRLPMLNKQEGVSKRKQDFTPAAPQQKRKRDAGPAKMEPPPKMPNVVRRGGPTSTATRPGTRAVAAKMPAARPAARGGARGAAKPATAAAPKAGGMTRATSASTIPKGAAGKKRPAWDLRGRLDDMEKAFMSLKSEKAEITVRSDNMEADMQALQFEKTRLQNVASDAQQHLQEADETIRSLQFKNRNMEDELERISHQKTVLERQKDDLQSDLEMSRTECRTLKNTIAQQAAAQEGIKAELQLLKSQLDSTNAALEAERRAHQKTTSALAEERNKVAEQDQELQQAETERRFLHNTIQELKGNIRVFARLRPLLATNGTPANDGELDNLPHFGWHDGTVLELDKPVDGDPNETMSGLKRTSSQKSEFNFDRVFVPSTTQQEVFEEISQLVQSALDGYNVCIFAYGQTGSGKTFTMEGDVEGDHRGMIPRAVEQVFRTADRLKAKGWEYKISASFLEIYNEGLRDLLDTKADKKMDIKIAKDSHHSKDDKTRDVYVSNLEIVEVNNQDEVHPLLKKANKNRAVAATKCNERSSRSHCVFQLFIKGSNQLTSETCSGMLNLIDLAGSEQVKKSGSQGKRLEEAQSINKSLSNLKTVIMALANKDNHIPYRNSKLTYLLQNSLGGNSKTLMFVNVSPQEEHMTETLNSLRFATQVNQCNIGTAQKRVK